MRTKKTILTTGLSKPEFNSIAPLLRQFTFPRSESELKTKTRQVNKSELENLVYIQYEVNNNNNTTITKYHLSSIHKF